MNLMPQSAKNFFRFNPFGRWFAKKIITIGWLDNPFYRRIYLNFIKDKAKKLSKGIPLGICVETTSGCNANCIMCPRSIGRARPSGVMTMELFSKILGDCEAIGKKDIELNVFGEPLVDPYLFERIKKAKDRGFKVSFFSNAALLDEKKSQKLIDLKCDKITFSVDGFSKEVYESIRVGLSRDLVYQNINRFLELKHAQKSEFPEISVSGILMDKNKKEMKSFFKYWRARPGIKHVLLASLRNWSGILKESQIGKLGELAQKSNWRPPCLQLWQGFNIFYDGRVPMCCDDAAEGRVIIGDVTEQSIEEIWRGKIMQKLRETHLSGKQDQILICKECPRTTVWWQHIGL